MKKPFLDHLDIALRREQLREARRAAALARAALDTRLEEFAELKPHFDVLQANGVLHVERFFLEDFKWSESFTRKVAARCERRARCGAKTRAGTPCQCKPETGRLRCKLHGGKSTGAKTAEGRERIAEAQRLRWKNNRSVPRANSPANG